ncbi:MAG: BTAD domain-containing putative transcriptional regulator [Bacillota bacterium]|nr:BTAD domain-containing putative transcriptional regulator [Bacillota bacterium]
MMEHATEKRLTLVSGAAGQGKTTLVADALKQMGYPVFWYSLVRNDINKVKFLNSLLEFLSELTSIPLKQKTTLDSVSDAQMISIFNDYIKESTLKTDFFIVIDNYERISSSCEFEDFTQYLFMNTPSNFHFVIISRPCFYRKLVSQKLRCELIDINHKNLTFTPAETKELFTNTYGIKLLPDQLDALLTLTEGWPIAMSLIGNKLLVESDIQEFVGNRDASAMLAKLPDLYLYLKEEIYNHLSSKQQNLLLAASVLEEIPSDLASSLADNEVLTLLDESVNDNLLVTCIDRVHGTYRFYALWRAFLYSKMLRNWSTTKISELQKHVGSYYFQVGQWKNAFRHYVEGHDIEGVITTLKQEGPQILDLYLTDKLYALMTSIPLGEMESDPWIQLAYASSLRFRNPTFCFFYTNRALDGFTLINDSKGIDYALFIKSEVLIFFPGDLSLMQNTINDNTLISHPKEYSELRTIAFKQAYTALSHCYLTGDMKEAIKLGEQAHRTSFILQDSSLTLWSCWALALTSVFMGNFDVARGYWMEAFENRNSPNNDDIFVALIPFLGGLLNDFMGDFVTAQVYLKMASYESKNLKLKALDFYIEHYASYAADYMGNQIDAEQFLEKMSSAVETYLYNNNYHIRSFYFVSKAHHAFLWKQTSQAVDWAYKALDNRRLAGGEIYYVTCHLTLGAALVDKGNLNEAEFHLLEALKKSTAICSTFFQASSCVQLSRLYHRLANQNLWLKYTETAFRLASQNSFYHFFLWRDQDIAELVQQSKDMISFQSYLEQLCQRRSISFNNSETTESSSVLSYHTQNPIRLFLLGPFYMDINGTVYENNGKRKVLHLLKLLAIRKEPLPVDSLIEEMWPGWDSKLGKNNFYFTLNQLRTLLGGKDMVYYKNGLCSIKQEQVWSDIDYFKYLIGHSKKLYQANEQTGAVNALIEAVDLYRGEFLEGDSLSESLSNERETLAKTYHDCLISSGKIFLELGQVEQAIKVLSQACSVPFSDEHSYRLLMLAHYAFGNQWQALEIYNNLSQYLFENYQSNPHKLTDELRALISSEAYIPLPEAINWLFSKENTYRQPH